MKTIPINPQKKVLRTVQLRGGFSDRNGINPVSTKIQFEDFDERTRTLIYNRFSSTLDAIDFSLKGIYHHWHHTWEELYDSVLQNVYCVDMTEVNNSGQLFYGYIKSTIMDDSYDAVLTVIEYVFSWTHKNFSRRSKFTDYDSCRNLENAVGVEYDTYDIDEYQIFNALFEQECVGYRFVANKIIRITDTVELTEIDSAAKCEFDGCRAHINNAIAFLADRTSKDYKNCIKESISAVESICKVIIGKENATLGDALKQLESKRGLKGPLKSAFEKLYSYTNDKGGIRHADGLFVSDVTFEEAKFMLVSCSAFVNYLIAEYGKMEEK